MKIRAAFLPHSQLFKLFGYTTVLCLFLLSGCGYHFEGTEKQASTVTISVPYIKGDPEGELNKELIHALSSSGQFDCVHSGGMFILEAAIIADSDSRIGYRFDRNPTTGKLRDNIIGTENRRALSIEVKLINAYTQEIVAGPQLITAHADYDYVDSNSVRDLTFVGPHGSAQTVIQFSLGQLDSVEGAHDDSAKPIYQILAQKIVDGLIVKSGCDLRAETIEIDPPFVEEQ